MEIKVQENGEHDIKFDRNTIAGQAKVPMHFSEYDIDGIIVNSFEGGSYRWAGVDRDKPEWSDRPSGAKGVPVSQWITKLLLEGKNVHLFDREVPSERWELTLEKLLKGIGLYAESCRADIDPDMWDCGDCDSILQFSLFGKLVYG